jgi:CRISPR-associated protein Csb1
MINFDLLRNAHRLLIEQELKPAQGTRFQPTGFPDLGPAEFRTPGGVPMLTVESHQSMANRLEATCWDPVNNTLISLLTGLPYVIVNDQDGKFLTASLLEAHRINSVYIMRGTDQSFLDLTVRHLEGQRVNRYPGKALGEFLLRYDPNCLHHGFFIPKLQKDSIRCERVVSAFIEATNVTVAPGGGVKNDIVDPSKEGGSADEGYGNVPYQRDTYVAEKITAYFKLDLMQLRSFGLPDKARDMILAWALWKTQAFLNGDMRLRTECDFVPAGDLRVTAPKGYMIPTLEELTKSLPGMIRAVAEAGLFEKNPVTTVTYGRPAKPTPGASKGTEANDGETGADPGTDDDGPDEDSEGNGETAVATIAKPKGKAGPARRKTGGGK